MAPEPNIPILSRGRSLTYWVLGYGKSHPWPQSDNKGQHKSNVTYLYSWILAGECEELTLYVTSESPCFMTDVERPCLQRKTTYRPQLFVHESKIKTVLKW